MIGRAISGTAAIASRLAHAAHCARVVRSQDLRVVLYHGLGDRSSPCMSSLADEISAEVFETHLDWMQERYRFVSLDEALTAVTNGAVEDRPLACITFDDGLASLYTQAQGLLARRQIPASVFLNTSAVGNGTLLWQHGLSYLIHEFGVPAVYQRLTLSTGWRDPAPESGLGIIQRCQERFSDLWRSGGVDSLFAHFGSDRSAVARSQRIYLEPDQIKQMAANQFTFYSHTASHFPLAHVEADRMKAEIDSARAAIPALAGSSSRCLSFPFGMWRDFGTAAQEYALSLGYTVLHVEDGWNPPARVSRSRTLRRVGLGDQERTASDLYAALELRPLMKGFLGLVAGRG